MSADDSQLPPELAALLTLDGPHTDAGPAQPLPRDDQAALVAQVMAGWRPADHAAGDGQPGGQRSPRVRALGGRGRSLAVAALLLGVGSAAAHYLATPARPAPPATDSPPVAQRGPTAAGEEAASTVAAADKGAAPAGAARDLLAAANRERGKGQYGRAEALYLRAATLDDGGPTAQVARVAAADLRLERLEDPRGALALYRQARSQDGPLSLEAMAGVARAQRALGDTDGERRALAALLETHGRGGATAWADERLHQLPVQAP